MTKSKKLLSVVMTLAMLVGMLTVFATNASAASPEWVNVPSQVVKMGTFAFVDSGIQDSMAGGSISSVTPRSGALPAGLELKYSVGSTVCPWVSGTPTEKGYFSYSVDLTLNNGKAFTLNFYILVTTTSPKERSETIYLDAGEYQSVRLLNREGIDNYDLIFTDSFKKVDIDGYVPRGMDWGFGEVDSPRVYGTPECAGEWVATFDIYLYDGNWVRDTVRFIVQPTQIITTSETVVFEAGKSYNYYLQDKSEDQYWDCDVDVGALPTGMDWSYSEVDGPRVYGTPEKAGIWKATFYIADFSGHVYNHKVTFIVEGDNPFVDVEDGKFYVDPVQWAVNHEPLVTNGTDSTHFSPNKVCTRAQVVTFLYRALGEPEVQNGYYNPFSDVDEGAYYFAPVCWAVETGVTNGVDANHFGPNQGCTRGQVVTFLWRALGMPEPSVTGSPFTDVKTDAYYYKAMLWAVENGVTNGMTATTFEPNTTCTRGQIVTFLCRAMVPEPTSLPVNPLGDEFLIYVEDVFTITGRGTVVTGRVTNGKIKTGEQVAIYTWDSEGNVLELDGTVIGIEMFHKILDTAEKGDNVGIQIDTDGSMKDKVQRGASVVKIGSRLKPVKYVTGTVYSDPKSRHTTMSEDNIFQYYVGTTDYSASFVTLNGAYNDERIFPDETRHGVVIEFIKPVMAYQGQEIAIRGGGMTYGTFTVTGAPRNLK
ncbi:MAG: S-layer homology domain-containing protein [Clostridia bacterium]|nr:S-layer homology domain-containing protein [Clostridia bacterium]